MHGPLQERYGGTCQACFQESYALSCWCLPLLLPPRMRFWGWAGQQLGAASPSLLLWLVSGNDSAALAVLSGSEATSEGRGYIGGWGLV